MLRATLRMSSRLLQKLMFLKYLLKQPFFQKKTMRRKCKNKGQSTLIRVSLTQESEKSLINPFRKADNLHFLQRKRNVSFCIYYINLIEKRPDVGDDEYQDGVGELDDDNQYD